MKKILCLIWTQFKALLSWLFLGNKMNLKSGRVFKFDYTVRITTKCRYNAAKRLQRQHRITKFTTIIVSLILILIPLMQLTKIQLNISDDVIMAMQCYFAIIMLVYTIINSMDNKELKIQNLQTCGRQLKEITRELDVYKEQNSMSDEEYIKSVNDRLGGKIDEYQKKYEDILKQSENHEDIDHLNAKMDIREHSITGLYYLISITKIFIFSFLIGNIASFIILFSAFYFFLCLIGFIDYTKYINCPL